VQAVHKHPDTPALAAMETAHVVLGLSERRTGRTARTAFASTPAIRVQLPLRPTSEAGPWRPARAARASRARDRQSAVHPIHQFISSVTVQVVGADEGSIDSTRS
jgi:hypothetical protein